MDEVRADAVGAHVVKGEHQLHLAVLQVVHGALHGDVVGLADDHTVVVRHAVAVKAQIIVQVRALGELLRAVCGRGGGGTGRAAPASWRYRRWRPRGSRPRPCPARSALYRQSPASRRGVVVQVRLLPGEHVQVVLAQLLVEFPGACRRKSCPSCWAPSAPRCGRGGAGARSSSRDVGRFCRGRW